MQKNAMNKFCVQDKVELLKSVTDMYRKTIPYRAIGTVKTVLKFPSWAPMYVVEFKTCFDRDSSYKSLILVSESMLRRYQQLTLGDEVVVQRSYRSSDGARIKEGHRGKVIKQINDHEFIVTFLIHNEYGEGSYKTALIDQKFLVLYDPNRCYGSGGTGTQTDTTSHTYSWTTNSGLEHTNI